MSRRTRRRLRRYRPLILLVLVSSGLLLLGGAVIGLQAWQAKHDLVLARAQLQAAQSAVTDGDQLSARAHLAQAQSHASRAHGRLTGWLWGVYAHLPIASAPVREVRGLVGVTDSVTSEVLSPLVDSAPSRGAWAGHADTALLRRIAGPLGSADVRLTAERARLAALPDGHVSQVGRARAQLAGALDQLAVDVRDANVATHVLPRLLGADEPARLLVVVQNQAEERATGGLIGAYAIVRTDDGSITRVGSGTDAEMIDADRPVVQLGADFQARYGQAEAASTWRSANLTPDLRSAGAILAGLSAKQLKTPVDGVVLVDPVALADVLRATGPVQAPGIGTLTADNAVEQLLSDVYKRYGNASQQRARKAALKNALDAMVDRLRSPLSGGGLVRELARAASTGHVQLYATHPVLEDQLVTSRIGGALPDRGPFLSLVTQDVGGSKLDYYLHRSVSYDATPSPIAVDLGVGPETVEDATVTATLRNDAPLSGLPAYVTARADTKHAPVGQLRSWVSVYLGPRSTYSSATLDGQPVALASEVENGLTVFSTYVDIDPGSSVTLVLRAQQPAPEGASLLWRQQPRLEPDQLSVRRTGATRPWSSVYAY